MARTDPYTNYRYLVEIDGIVQAGFSECTGVGSRVEVIEYREGGDSATVRKLRGRVSYPDIVLRWGVTDSHELVDWHRTAVEGSPQRRNGSIVLVDDDGTEKLRWNFFGAWPHSWDGPSFNARGSDIAITSLSVSCERLEQV
jgi:phage tail-like protein